MRWPWSKPEPPSYTTPAHVRRDEARMDRILEAEERSAIACFDCEIGEPHACERAWWGQRAAHLQRRECFDPDCLCHPEQCECCGQTITRESLLRRIEAAS